MNETNETNVTRTATTTRPPTFATRDFYLAAFLTIYDIPLLATYQLPNGRTEFAFANEDGAAYRLFQDFRTAAGNDVVSLRDFRKAYRVIADAARDAKDNHYDHSRD